MQNISQSFGNSSSSSAAQILPRETLRDQLQIFFRKHFNSSPAVANKGAEFCLNPGLRELFGIKLFINAAGVRNQLDTRTLNECELNLDHYRVDFSAAIPNPNRPLTGRRYMFNILVLNYKKEQLDALSAPALCGLAETLRKTVHDEPIYLQTFFEDDLERLINTLNKNEHKPVIARFFKGLEGKYYSQAFTQRRHVIYLEQALKLMSKLNKDTYPSHNILRESVEILGTQRLALQNFYKLGELSQGHFDMFNHGIISLNEAIGIIDNSEDSPEKNWQYLEQTSPAHFLLSKIHKSLVDDDQPIGAPVSERYFKPIRRSTASEETAAMMNLLDDSSTYDALSVFMKDPDLLYNLVHLADSDQIKEAHNVLASDLEIHDILMHFDDIYTFGCSPYNMTASQVQPPQP